MSYIVNKILDFSAIAGLYDYWASRSIVKVHDALVELANLHGREKVLDVGCGTGMLGLRLAELCDDMVVCGLDIGPQMIKVARKKAANKCPNLRYTTGTAVMLPYPHEYFNVVFSCLVFHLLEDAEIESALKELFRVLTPGGRYVCAEFQEYPAGFFRRETLKYPSEIIRSIGFKEVEEFGGPAITRRRRVVYRLLMKPTAREPSLDS